MNEKYNNASIIFLRELYEQEDFESQKLKRKREISRSNDYNEEISYHEWRKKMIEYLMIFTRSSEPDILSSGHEKGMQERIEGKLEAYLELVRDKVISLEEAASRLNVSEEELKIRV